MRSFRKGPKRGVKPRVISDNGPQFIAKDFKEFIRISGMTARPDFTVFPSIHDPLATFRFASPHKPVFSGPSWRNEISAMSGVLSNRSPVKFGRCG